MACGSRAFRRWPDSSTRPLFHRHVRPTALIAVCSRPLQSVRGGSACQLGHSTSTLPQSRMYSVCCPQGAPVTARGISRSRAPVAGGHHVAQPDHAQKVISKV
ncbi:hypothetical protein NDU88_003167 [Pleurodeles waltl]|uniref:Uncharacterized protein n=1 Tax=Pleurodeles waltl TaxID=8319 RepID=A0AAV7T477_PLEWA|nr:hypothetical protein NDU88_003167 [Pleurodeles waltl]